VVNYTSGSGTSTLTFNYTVVAGHNTLDLDYHDTGALIFNGGTIKDLAGNIADLTLFTPGTANSLGANKDIVIDTIAPTVTINQAAGQVDPATTSPINFTVVFSEPVTGFITGDVTLTGNAGATTATVTGGPTIYNVAVSGMATGGTNMVTIAANRAQDAAGNNNIASTSTDNVVTFCLPPSITSQPANTTACQGNTTSFSVTAAGTGLTYQWYKNNVLLANGLTGNTFNTWVTSPSPAKVTLQSTYSGVTSSTLVINNVVPEMV